MPEHREPQFQEDQVTKRLDEIRGSTIACMEQGYIQPNYASDVIALIDLAKIVTKRRARFAVKPYPAGWHPKNAEEEAMDSLLEGFNA